MKHMDLRALAQSFPELDTPEILQEIHKVTQWKSYREGQSVMEIGSEILGVPLVVKGSLKISREDDQGRELLLYYLRSGDVCALSFSCCMVRQRSEVRAIAEEETLLCIVPLDRAEKWLLEYPQWKSLVMLGFRSRFLELLDTLDSLAFSSMDQRLWNWLRDKAAHHGNPVTKTHQEIADELHTSREVVSRLLKQMERKGMVELGRNRIEVKDS
jgi:CRP/FNR family transcriptional regulator